MFLNSEQNSELMSLSQKDRAICYYFCLSGIQTQLSLTLQKYLHKFLHLSASSNFIFYDILPFLFVDLTCLFVAFLNCFIYIHKGILHCNFLTLPMSMFSTKMILVLEDELRNIFSSYSWCYFFLKCLVKPPSGAR